MPSSTSSTPSLTAPAAADSALTHLSVLVRSQFGIFFSVPQVARILDSVAVNLINGTAPATTLHEAFVCLFEVADADQKQELFRVGQKMSDRCKDLLGLLDTVARLAVASMPQEVALIQAVARRQERRFFPENVAAVVEEIERVFNRSRVEHIIQDVLDGLTEDQEACIRQDAHSIVVL